jgi:hypothetical protein
MPFPKTRQVVVARDRPTGPPRLLENTEPPNPELARPEQRIPMPKNNNNEIREALCERFRNEGVIVRDRIRILLTFEGFLFASLAFTVKNDLYMLAVVLAALGAIACLPVYYSVRLSFEAAAKLGTQFQQLTPTHDYPPLAGYDVGTRGGIFLLPEVFLPILISIAWVSIAVILLWKQHG